MKKIGNIIKYLIIFVLNLLMFFFLHGYFNLVILILLILFPMVSFFAAYRVKRGITFSFRGPRESMHIDDMFNLGVRIKNDTLFPIINAELTIETENTFLGYKGKENLNIPIHAHTEDEILFPLMSEHLGLLHIELKKIRITDWLGIMDFSKKLDDHTEISILPFSRVSVEPDLSVVNTGMTEMEESKKKGHDYSEVSEIREYQPGDKLQNIHWKLSAKKDELMVKDRESLSSSQILMLVELYNNKSVIIDRIISAAYGAAVYFLQNQIPFSLMWWSVAEQDMKSRSIDNSSDLYEWIMAVYYEVLYSDATMGCDMMRRLSLDGSRFLVICEAKSVTGLTLFNYEGDVEGIITE